MKILGEVSAGKAVKEVCSAHGLSEATFYTWKRKYAGMESDDVRRLRELEKEKLLRKNEWRTPATEGASFPMSKGVKARRACHIMGVSTAAPYRKAAPDKDAELREKLRATWRPDMSYRMAHALVKESFAPLNVKRVHRIWKEEKLGRMKRYRKRRTGETVRLPKLGQTSRLRQAVRPICG